MNPPENEARCDMMVGTNLPLPASMIGLAMDPRTDFDLIGDIERMAACAWPALETEDLDGWRLRYSQGVTRRANSVWPNALDENGDLSLAERLARVEAFYAARRLPARYQICPAAQPPELDAELTARHYAAVAETAVMTAPVAAALDALAQPEGWRVTCSDQVDAAWMGLYAAVEEVAQREVAVRRAIMQAIQPPAAYAMVWAGTDAVAVGSAVCTGRYVGLFNLGTLPAWRRRGGARAAMAALLKWAAGQGAQVSYLQVMVRNEPAIRLYSRLGYTEQYRYFYREQPFD